MSETTQNATQTPFNQIDLVYGLHDKPPVFESIFAALQHLLAMFVGIITPATIVSGALGFSLEMSSYLISMTLVASGIATFIQCKHIGPLGSGLLSIQGTSFAFLGTLLMSGVLLQKEGVSDEVILTTLFGTCFSAAFVEMIISRFLRNLSKIITPLVSGIVVTLIGMTLIKVAMTDIGGGFSAIKANTFGQPENLMLGFIVLAIIVVFNRSKNKYIRMSAIAAGLLTGYVIAFLLGKVDFSQLSTLSFVTVPVPFKYGMFQWDFAIFIPFSLLFVITAVESIGDLTATSMVSREPISGEEYIQRMSRGILADGFNSAMAACLNAFPCSTFSQNNGVIQITGVASRRIGLFVGGFLVLFGLSPVIGGIFKLMPPSVLGGATLIMFGSVGAAGVKIIASTHIDRKAMLIMAISFGTGLGIAFVPDVLKFMPSLVQRIFSSPVTTGGLTAILCNLIFVLKGSSATTSTADDTQDAKAA